ncbi:MAG: LPXTG cell wall anchor domain-containing protein, partial [Ruminococcus sp.]|nr:LPXTG cell wall anchor domain-containing protein [Ruminococcus sp.]
TTTSATTKATTTTTESETTSTTTTEPTTTSTTEPETTTTSTVMIKEKEAEITELTTTEIITTTTATESETTTTTNTTTAEETTTTTTETEETTTESTTTSIIVIPITSDEELCNWAVNDYNYKNYYSNREATIAFSAEITSKSDAQYEISLKDASDNVIDVYIIDAETGIGADSNNGEVNLPQTGNNSLTNIIIAFGASMMTVFGLVAVRLSGIFRRKKNE